MKKTNFIETYSGIQFYPLEPEEKDVNIIDIAHSLSHLCRYSGHCKFFYSVAQHSVNIYHLLKQSTNNPVILMDGLLHDATEAYMVDLPKPLKEHMDEYSAYEERLQKVIYSYIGLPKKISSEVKHADNIMLSHEAAILMPCRTWNFNPIVLKEISIEERLISDVRNEFLSIFYKLNNELL